MPFPTPGDLLDPGIKATSLASLALAGELEPQSIVSSGLWPSYQAYGPPHSGKVFINDSNTVKVHAVFSFRFP